MLDGTQAFSLKINQPYTAISGPLQHYYVYFQHRVAQQQKQTAISRSCFPVQVLPPPSCETSGKLLALSGPVCLPAKCG